MKKSYEIDMCDGPLLSKILLFSVPLMMSGILQLLFNAADIIVVGRFAGSSALAAVGSTSSLINLLINVFVGLSVGVNVLVAKYYGGQREKDMSGNQEKKENQNMEQPPVIRLDRQLKYQGNILKIYEDVVLANGHKAHWDFIHHDGAAAVLPVADDGRILMVRQYRNALDKFTLEIPAGKLDDPKEPKIRCAFRELEEETGFKADHLEYLMSLNTTVAFCDEAIDIFVAHHLIPSKQHLDEDEVINVEPWELKDLEELIYRGEITDGKTIAAIMAYARKYRSVDKRDEELDSRS